MLQVGKFLDTLRVWKNCIFFAYIHGRLYYEFNEWTHHEYKRNEHHSLRKVKTENMQASQ